MPDAQDSKLHSLWHVAALAFVLLAAAAGAAHAQPGTTVCPTRSIGPGALLRGGTVGATCILRAYRQGCRTAQYELSSFGVDTIATIRFGLQRRNGSCSITVNGTFRVVPQKPHVTSDGRCRTLRTTANDIIATGCSGKGLTPTISLTH